MNEIWQNSTFFTHLSFNTMKLLIIILSSVCPSCCLSDNFSLCPAIHLTVYPSICLPIHLSIHMSVCLSICPSVCLFIFPSVPPSSVWLSIRPSIHQFVHLPNFMYPSLCLSFYLSVLLSVCPFICLSFYLSVRPSICLSIFSSAVRPSDRRPSIC